MLGRRIACILVVGGALGPGCVSFDADDSCAALQAELLARNEVADVEAVDCSVRADQPESVRWWQAHDCVLAAVDSERPFFISWSAQGAPDDTTLNAVVGRETPDGYEITSYSGYSNLDTPTTVRRVDCAQITSRTDCGEDQAELSATLCLECIQTTQSVVICR